MMPKQNDTAFQNSARLLLPLLLAIGLLAGCSGGMEPSEVSSDSDSPTASAGSTPATSEPEPEPETL